MTSRTSVLLSCAALVFALVLAPSPAQAQVQTQFGVQGGINIANVDFTTSDPDDFNPTWKSRTRGVGGFVVAWDFNPNVGLQIDMLYSQKGAKTSFTDEDGRGDIEASLDYIEFPVLFRANMPASDAVTFRVFAGPAFGFKVSDEVKLTFEGVDVSDEDDTSWKSYDVSLVAGGAVQFGQFFVDARYSWGMVNVLDEEGEEVKTRTFGLMFGFMF